MKRGPGPLSIVAFVFLLLGIAYITVEFIQRTRFDNRRLNVESLMLGIQGTLTFHLDKDGTIRIPEAGQIGAMPVIFRDYSEYRRGRFCDWTVTIPVSDPNLPGAVVQKKVMYCSLVQERVGFLRNPFIVIMGTRDCDSRVLEALRLRICNQNLNDIAQIGF